MASDGLWEFLDNKQVRDIVTEIYMKDPTDPDKACQVLYDKSDLLWR